MHFCRKNKKFSISFCLILVVMGLSLFLSYNYYHAFTGKALERDVLKITAPQDQTPDSSEGELKLDLEPETVEIPLGPSKILKPTEIIEPNTDLSIKELRDVDDENNKLILADNLQTSDPNISVKNADELVKEVLDEHMELLAEEINEETELVALETQENENFYTNFEIQYEGVPVFGRFVQTVTNEDGEIISIDSKLDEDIAISNDLALTKSDAIKAAQKLVNWQDELDEINDIRMVICPLENDQKTDYRLAYEINLKAHDPFGLWNFIIDAENEELLADSNAILLAETRVLGKYLSNYASDEPKDTPFAFERIFYPSNLEKLVYTGEEGLFLWANEEFYTELQSPFVTVHNDQKGEDARLAFSEEPPTDIFWGTKATIDETNAFYHINKFHQIFADYFTFPEELNVPVEATVFSEEVEKYLNGCASFYNPPEMKIELGSGSGCDKESYARYADVILHEYAHSLVNRVYYLDPNIDPQARVMNEALADYFVAVYTGDSEVGEIILDNPRELENNLELADWSGILHQDSQIFSGALWDLRSEIGSNADELIVRALYQQKYNFEDFMYTLLVEDRGESFEEGTVNEQIILDSFYKHGIGPGYTEFTTPIVEEVDTEPIDSAGEGEKMFLAVGTPTIYSGTEHNNQYFVGTISIRASHDAGVGITACEADIGGGFTTTNVTFDNNYCYYNSYTPNADFSIQFRADDGGGWINSVVGNYIYDNAAPIGSTISLGTIANDSIQLFETTATDSLSGLASNWAYFRQFDYTSYWNLDNILAASNGSFRGEGSSDQSGQAMSPVGDVNNDGYDDFLIAAPNDNNSTGEIYLFFGKAAGFANDLSLSTADASFLGEAISSYSGFSVSGVGDVNNDNFDDFLIGAYGHNSITGKTYLFLGKAAGWSTNVSLNTADASFIGENPSNYSGYSVSGVGNVNNDSYDDFIISAPGNSENVAFAGQTYLILGKAAGWSPNTNLSTADASFWGEDGNDFAGAMVSGAGDVDNDGFDDFLIGSAYDSDNGANSGQTYLVLGKASGWTMDNNLSGATASFLGENANDQSAFSLSGGFDFDNDNYDDFLIGAYQNADGGANAGQTYVIFGKASGWAMDENLSNADASFIGEAAGDKSGHSVAGIGDANGDSIDDFIIGAPENGESASGAGQAYLVLGRTSGWPMDTNLASAAASYQGESTNDYGGYAVSGAGDINGDSFYDFLIGAPGDDDTGSDAGQTYLVTGDIAVNDSGWVNGSTGYIYNSLSPNTSYNFVVKTTDNLGNESVFTTAISVYTLSDDADIVEDNGINTDTWYNDNFVFSSSNLDSGAIDYYQYIWDTSASTPVANCSSGSSWNSSTLELLPTLGTSNYLHALSCNADDASASEGVQHYGSYWFENIDPTGAAITFDTVTENSISVKETTATDTGGSGLASEWANFQETDVYSWSMDTNLSEADASFLGDPLDRIGWGVSDIGDVNDDGFDDFALAAPFNREPGGVDPGQVYIFFGKTSGWTTGISVKDADASYWGEAASNNVGKQIAAAGDVNNDGYDDFLISSTNNSENGTQSGQTYLILGKASGWVHDVSLGSVDASYLGENSGDFAGSDISGIGDINDDGYDDFAICSPTNSSYDGQTYIIFGKASGWTMDNNLGSVDASFIGSGDERSCWSIGGGGDLNGDTIDDMVIGAYTNGQGGFRSGKTYIVFGKASGWAMDTAISTADASFIGQSEDYIGYDVAIVGDANGDNLDDFVTSTPFDDYGGLTWAGNTFLVLGKASGWSNNASITTATASFRGENDDDQTGRTVSEAGDVNADGYDDFMINSWRNADGGNNAGQTYLILGKSSGWALDTSLADADASFLGEVAEDRSGYGGISAAGDVNDDGYDDFIIGSYSNDENGSGAGKAYLILSGEIHDSGWIDGSIGQDFTSLQANTLYDYKVTVRDNAGNLSVTTTKVIKSTLIETPTGLTVVDKSTNSIDLSVDGTLSNLDLGSSGININASGSGAGSESCFSGNWCQETSATDTGLIPNTEYSYQVKARNQQSVETAYTGVMDVYTLPLNSDVVEVFGRTTSTWYTSGDFTFSSANLDSDSIDHYQYVWDQNPTTTLLDCGLSGTEWLSGDITEIPAESDSNYLHVIACNADDEIADEGTAHYGPYYFDSVPPEANAIYQIEADPGSEDYVYNDPANILYYGNNFSGPKGFAVYVYSEDATSGLLQATFPNIFDTDGGVDDTEAGNINYEYNWPYSFTNSETADGSFNVTVEDIAGNNSIVSFNITQDYIPPDPNSLVVTETSD